MSSADADIKVLLKDIVDLLPAHVYWANKDMVYLGCNELQAKTIGLASPKEIEGKTIYDFDSGESAERVIYNNQQVLKNRRTMIFEETVILPNGMKAIFLSLKSPLFNQIGEVIGLLGVSSNMTDKRTKEKNTEVLLEQIISNLPGNVYWKNRLGVYLGCNNNLAKMVNFSSSKEVVGKTLNDIFPNNLDVIEKIFEEDERIMQENRGKTFEEIGLNINQKKAIYLTSKVPLHDYEGNVIGLLGLSFDITERKKIEGKLKETKDKAIQANRSKTEFLDETLEQFKKPFNQLKKELKLFSKKIPKESFERTEKSLLELEKIIQEVKGFAKFDLLEENHFSSESENEIELEVSNHVKSLKPSIEKMKTFCEFYKRFGLTFRQAECVYYMIRGMTAKKIGRITGLSNRTVEFYLNQAKSKLGCKVKEELIDKVFEKGVV